MILISWSLIIITPTYFYFYLYQKQQTLSQISKFDSRKTKIRHFNNCVRCIGIYVFSIRLAIILA